MDRERDSKALKVTKFPILNASLLLPVLSFSITAVSVRLVFTRTLGFVLSSPGNETPEAI